MNYKEVYEEIVKALDNGTPFSLIRCGDGEYLCASGHKREYVMRRQFNHSPSQEDQNYIGELVKDAYTEATIIGIPTQHHIDNCGIYWARTYEYLVQQRPIIKDIPCCSIDVHSELLKSGLLHELLMNQDDLFYIAGYNLDDKFRKVFNIRNVNSFVVSPEQLFQERKSETHWPYQYNACLKWIEESDVQGKLCLVGAGVLGKFYSHLLKRKGAIVCEIGHVFDSWKGKVTRGKGRSATATDDKYKL